LGLALVVTAGACADNTTPGVQGAGATPAPQAVLLRCKFTSDQVRSYDLSVTGQGQMAMAGAQIPLNMTVGGSFDVLTRAVSADGSGHIGLHLAPLTMDMTVMGNVMHMTVDVEKGTFMLNGQPMQAPGAGAAGAAPRGGLDLSKLTLVLNPRGQVTDVQGLETLLASLPASGGRVPGAEMLPLIGGMLKNNAMALPEGPVAVGATWEQPLTFTMPGGLVVPLATTKSTLEKIAVINGEQFARIGSTANCRLTNLPLPVAPGQPGGGTINGLTTQVQAETYFDVTAGYMHSAHVEVTLDMTLTTVPGAGTAPAGGGQPMQLSIQGLKLYYNIYPHGGESAAAQM
jgi:hypothetical protein